MDKPILYAFSEADLEKIIEKTIDRLSKEKPIQNSDLPPVEDRLTQQEAAEHLEITVQTLIKWKKKNLIPVYQIENSIFYSKTELNHVIRNNPKLVKLPKD